VGLRTRYGDVEGRGALRRSDLGVCVGASDTPAKEKTRTGGRGDRRYCLLVGSGFAVGLRTRYGDVEGRGVEFVEGRRALCRGRDAAKAHREASDRRREKSSEPVLF